jgi:hypothetical protein
VKKFLDWAHSRGHRTLASITSEDFIAYQQWLLQTELGPSQRGMHRRAARLFWVFRAGLHTDRLCLDPQRLQSWQIDNCQPPRRIENATDRTPEEVISPLLVWALRWVNDFSHDVIAARDEWWLLYTAGHPKKGPQRTGERMSSKLAALQNLLNDYRRVGRPLPTNGDGVLNRNFLARQLRREPTFIGKLEGQAMIAAAVGELGLAPDFRSWWARESGNL